MSIPKKNRILIVGGTGFVGEYVARLLSKNKADSICVIYSGKFTKKDQIPGIQYFEMDLTKKFRNKKVIRNMVDDLTHTVIMTQPDNLIVKNIIEMLNYAPSLKKIIFTSTILVYPSSVKKLTELVKPRPVSVYEKGKIAEEKLLTNYSKKRNMKLSIIRLANVYGDLKNRGIIGIIFNSLSKNDPITINGDGKQKRDYIFIKDAAELIAAVILNEQKNQLEIINVCTGKNYSLRTVIKLIEKIADKKLSVHYGRSIKEKRSIIGSNAKLAKLLKQKPAYNLAGGLEKTYLNYFKE